MRATARAADTMNDFSRQIAIDGLCFRLGQADPQTLRDIADTDRKLAASLAFFLLAHGETREDGLPPE